MLLKLQTGSSLLLGCPPWSLRRRSLGRREEHCLESHDTGSGPVLPQTHFNRCPYVGLCLLIGKLRGWTRSGAQSWVETILPSGRSSLGCLEPGPSVGQRLCSPQLGGAEAMRTAGLGGPERWRSDGWKGGHYGWGIVGEGESLRMRLERWAGPGGP